MIEVFLKKFYDTISFQANEQWNEKQFRKLFLPNAVLMEENEGKYECQTLSQYIQRFQGVLKEHPQFFTQGFIEKGISYEVLETENGYLIASRYKKHYTVDGKLITEYGTNNMIVVVVEEELKISSIL